MSLMNVPPNMVHPVPGSVPPVYHTNWTPGDGSCLFSAFAKGLVQNHQGYVHPASVLRKEAVHWMGTYSELFLPFVSVPDGVEQDQAFKDYLRRMSQPDAWGGELELKALSQTYKVNVGVLKRRDNHRHMWAPSEDMVPGQRTFWLYLSGNHYENLLAPSQIL